MTLRPPEDDDFDAMLELMNAHQLAAFGEADVTEDELRTWLTSPSVEVERDIRVLEQDGRLVGYVDVDSNGADPPLWWCDLKLAPDVDEDPIAAELVGWLEERLDAGRVRVWTSATDTRVVSALERLGFAPVRHSYRMEIDLADETRPSPSGRAGSRFARSPTARSDSSTTRSSRSGRTRRTRLTTRSRTGATG